MGSKHEDMSANRPAPKLIRNADFNAFALVMALVVFAFLACYMTTMGFNPHADGVWPDLPRVLHPVSVGGLTWGANRHDAIIISVRRNGDIFMKNDLVSDWTLASKIHESINEGAESKVYIRADARTPYGIVKTVLGAVQTNGVKDVAFLAYERRVVPSRTPSGR